MRMRENRWMLWVLVLAAAFAANASALVVERIEVRNAQRVSPQLIAAESLLREGREYSDADLQAAEARLTRLPFLAAVEISTEGNAVVITVTETRSFSFLLDARGVKLGESRTGLDTDYAFPDPASPWKNAAAGVRHVIGKGEAHFAMTVLRNRRGFGKNYSAWEIGYTGYDLFGTSAFATAKVRTPVDSVSEGTFTPAFSVGLPLTFHQTVSIEVEDTLFRDQNVTIGGTGFRRLDAERQITFDWIYNTTDQPYAPSRGTYVRVSPVWWMHEFTSVLSARPGQPAQPRTEHQTARGVELAALRHWELSRAHSVSAGVFGSWADFETRRTPEVTGIEPGNPSYQMVQAGYSRRLGASSRLQFEARGVRYEENAFDDAFEFSVDWTHRSRWGTLRLGAGYVSAY